MLPPLRATGSSKSHRLSHRSDSPPYTYYSQEPRATIGEYSRIVLRVDDVGRAYEELTAKGVRFDGEPFESTGGTFAAMRDPWGNFFVLSQSQPSAGL
jgi:predicted enzyme related to lactoylglutathione lyase